MDIRLRTVLIDTLILSCLFFIAAGVSLYLSSVPHVITTLWLSNIIGIVLLLRHKANDWLIPLIGLGFVNFLAYVLFGNNLISSGYFTIINLFEIVLTVLILRRFQIVKQFSRNIKSAFILVLTTALVVPAISAALGTFFFGSNNRMHVWIRWFVGDGLCMTTLLPVTLCFMRTSWHDLTLQKIRWTLLWLLIVFCVTLSTVLYLPYAFITLVVPLLLVAIYSSVYFTIVMVGFNAILIFTLYNAGIFYPLVKPIFEQTLVVYFPTILTCILPYFLAVFMAILNNAKEKLSNSEAMFRSAMENSAVGMALVSTDGYWFMVNEAYCNILGYSKAEFKKLTVTDITYPEDLSRTLDILEKLKSGTVSQYNTEKRYYSKRGQIVWVRLSVSAVRDKNQVPQFYIAHIEDINQSKQLEIINANLSNSLYDEKEHLKILLTSIMDSVIATDEHGLITFMNPEAEKITGWLFDDVKGAPINDIFKIVNKDNSVLASPIMYCLENVTALTLVEDVFLISKTGEKFDIQYAVSILQNKDKKLIGAEVVFQNVTNAKSLQAELSYNATHDSLTGLLNRREFEKALNKAVLESKSKGTHYILCYLDLDFFKIVNDSAGHVAGDALLQEIARLLTQRIRVSDVLARLGGDEFGILLIGSSLSTGKKICQQLIDLVNSIRFCWENKVYRIGMSIGIVLIGDQAGSASQLLSDADVACYAAKAEGRNQVFVYQKEEIESIEYSHGIIMANTIQDALENNNLLLYAQKIRSTNPERSASAHFEILIRMLDEKKNIISASSFISIAERFNLMVNIDRWVLTQLLEYYAKKPCKMNDAFFSINLSANSLNDPGFLTFLLPLIEQSALLPEQLCFEITETASMNHISKTITIVTELQRIGCKVALDDFGVGLSSFSYVKNFTVDFIKIDGSFVRNVVDSEVDRTIVQTINEMAHRLGMKTIAECVENKAILNVISKLGVDYMQGYAIGKPMSLDKIIGK